MDLGWKMGLIAEFVFWMALLAQCMRFQESRLREVVRGFPHQSNLFLERVLAFATGFPLSVVVNCHDSSSLHFIEVN
jgi:hypothetical protein